MESIQTFLKLDGLFKAKVNVPAKTIQFILNLDSWQKVIKNRSVGNFREVKHDVYGKRNDEIFSLPKHGKTWFS